MDDTAHRRLAAQHLSGPPLPSASAVVGWFGAVQAQDYGAARWAVGQRTGVETDARLERAFDAGEILRTHVLRPTWHFVLPEDARWLLELSGPRVLAGLAGRFRELELDEPALGAGAQAIAAALAGGRHLTRPELGAVLAGAGISPAGQRLPHLLAYAELTGLVISGARRGRQHTYALLEERARPSRIEAEAAAPELARRYFQSHGPARLADFTWWSGLAARDARAAIRDAGDALRREVAEGVERWFGAGAPRPAPEPRAHLLPNFDEYTVAYRHREAALHPERPIDPSLFAFGSILGNVLLLDGRVHGAWTRKLERGRVRLEIRLLGTLAPDEAAAVTAAAGRLSDFLGRPVDLVGLVT